ncbi:MAG: excinuclease ABC subunit B [Salibacteraceae bacterium]|jgi:excinuclease ABC subunit B
MILERKVIFALFFVYYFTPDIYWNWNYLILPNQNNRDLEFKLTSEFKPTGDQPQAIEQLVDGVNNGEVSQVLLGVTGSGKTFTMANVIQETGRPTLVLCHNKTLAAQLYGEFKQFFPENAVEYFVSYYDYYQPEAYIPTSGTYIEKDLSINDEIEKLRLSATSALLSGRRDVIIISSVSCIYGIGNPKDFNANIIELKAGQTISRNKVLHRLVDALYSRTTAEFERGNFRVIGDSVDIFPAYADYGYKVIFWGDEIEELHLMNPVTGDKIESLEEVKIFPANIFVTSKDTIQSSQILIAEDMNKQVEYFKNNGMNIEAQRLEERVNYDLEMIRELGYCSGIENYSRYFDGREPGSRPFCLLDYFPDDYLMMIDESHVTVSQVKAMYGGDRSRKMNLVEYGFRLPSAMDNRPLTFSEFENIQNQTIYVSATPADYELQRTEGVYVEQVIRPTGLIDPIIEIRPVGTQVDDLLEEIRLRQNTEERVLVTTLTKRMSEELTKYLIKNGVKCRYIHSEVDTLERVEILRDLRLGVFDVLVGINLLREGLDLPEVSLVAILDADKEGFLRSETSMTQTAGRAARNVKGKVIMYADKITGSMQRTIDTTDLRRAKQMKYNEEHGIVPTQIVRSKDSIMNQTAVASFQPTTAEAHAYMENEASSLAADPVVKYMTHSQLEKAITRAKGQMLKASKALDFIEAARVRDEMKQYQSLLAEMEN